MDEDSITHKNDTHFLHAAKERETILTPKGKEKVKIETFVSNNGIYVQRTPGIRKSHSS